MNTKTFCFEEGEILNICKPQGLTSFRVVKIVRGITGVKKVGHAGTLDPFAEGVLLICTGKATKQVATLMTLSKKYQGVIELGIETDSDDLTGNIIRTHDVPQITIEQFEQVCQQFTGEIHQIPPMYSAKKIGGRRLYKIARKGEVVERPASIVHIYSINILKFDLPYVSVAVHCSKGTYIRALARDIGQKIGCGAHLKALTRTAIGDYLIDNSMSLERFKQQFGKNI